MEIPLREGNLNVFLRELPMDFGEDVMPRRETQIEAGQEKSYLQLKCTVGEKFKERGRLRLFQYIRMVATDLPEDFARLGSIRTVSNTDLDDHAIGGVGESPVEKSPCDEVLVRDHEFLLVEIHHRGCSHSNPGDGPRGISNGNHIPNTNRLLEQQDQA